MTAAIHITYLFDPLCGWCYGASPVIAKLAALPAYEVTLLPTGLFANRHAPLMDAGFAAYAWSNDQRIARLTGQPFSEQYQSKVLADRKSRLDSSTATLALTAVALTAPEREIDALQTIQAARYVDGRDITAAPVLAEILRGLKLNAAATRFEAADAGLQQANDKRTVAAQALMRRFGAEGVPTLIAGSGDQRRMLNASDIFGDGTLIAKLSAVDATAGRTDL